MSHPDPNYVFPPNWKPSKTVKCGKWMLPPTLLIIGRKSSKVENGGKIPSKKGFTCVMCSSYFIGREKANYHIFQKHYQELCELGGDAIPDEIKPDFSQPTWGKEFLKENMKKSNEDIENAENEFKTPSNHRKDDKVVQTPATSGGNTKSSSKSSKPLSDKVNENSSRIRQSRCRKCKSCLKIDCKSCRTSIDMKFCLMRPKCMKVVKEQKVQTDVKKTPKKVGRPKKLLKVNIKNDNTIKSKEANIVGITQEVNNNIEGEKLPDDSVDSLEDLCSASKRIRFTEITIKKWGMERNALVEKRSYNSEDFFRLKMCSRIVVEKARVLLISNMNKEIAGPQCLYNLCSIYGDVARVRVFLHKPDCALVEFTSTSFAHVARENLDNVEVQGQKMVVSFSHYDKIKLPQEEGKPEDPNIKEFESEEFIKLRRYRSEELKALNCKKIVAPSTTLHVGNVLPESSSTDLKDIFIEFGLKVTDIVGIAKKSIKRTKESDNPSRMFCYVDFTDIDEALLGLAKVGNTNGIELTFTKDTIEKVKKRYSDKNLLDSLLEGDGVPPLAPLESGEREVCGRK